MISEARAQVKSKTIKNCFVKAGFPDSHNETDVKDTVILDEEHGKSLQTGISFEEYAKCDDEIATFKLCTTDELIKENFQDVSSGEDNSKELISSSFNEALKSVETLSENILCVAWQMRKN